MNLLQKTKNSEEHMPSELKDLIQNTNREEENEVGKSMKDIVRYDLLAQLNNDEVEKM